MKIIDLSWPISQKSLEKFLGKKYIADTNRPKIEIISHKTLEKSTSASTLISTLDHNLTHVDSPSHVVAKGVSVDKIKLNNLTGHAAVIDLSKKKRGTPILTSDLKKAKIRKNSIVLCFTGYKGASKKWPNYTYLSEEGAKFLVKKKVKLVGIDTPSIESFLIAKQKKWFKKGTKNPWIAHKILLRNNIYIVEGLINLDKLKDKKFLFIALPLKIEHCSGGPARAIAIVQ